MLNSIKKTPNFLTKIFVGILLLACFNAAYAEQDPEVDDNADYKEALASFKKKDYAKSLQLFKKMADANQPFAMYQVGYMHEQGHGVPINSKVATEWYTKAAKAGDAGGQFSLANAYLKGTELPKNNELGFSWMSKAAEQGDASAQYQLSVLYSEGVGTAKDPIKSFFWTRKSAMGGIPAAQFNMGLNYDNGLMVPKDDNQARMWYTKAAQQSYAKAQTNLANLLFRNKQSANDELVQEAFFWYGKAASQNDVIALTSLGDMMLDPNKDGPQNKEAFKLYEKAAQLGDAKGQFNIAYMYENGIGVTSNPALALEWMQKAAKNGSDLAKKHLEKNKTAN